MDVKSSELKSSVATGEWISVNKQLPEDWTEVDVWFEVPASPRSFGISDSWREPNCYRIDGKWFHRQNCEVKELYAPYITHWMPIPDAPTQAPDPRHTDECWQTEPPCDWQEDVGDVCETQK
jgi:hypothetical protein